MPRFDEKTRRSQSLIRPGESIQDALARRAVEARSKSISIAVRIAVCTVVYIAYFGVFVHYIAPFTFLDYRSRLLGSADVVVGLTAAAAAPLIGLWFARRMTHRAKTSAKYILGAFLFLLAAGIMFVIGVGLVLMDYHRILESAR